LTIKAGHACSYLSKLALFRVCNALLAVHYACATEELYGRAYLWRVHGLIVANTFLPPIIRVLDARAYVRKVWAVAGGLLSPMGSWALLEQQSRIAQQQQQQQQQQHQQHQQRGDASRGGDGGGSRGGSRVFSAAGRDGKVSKKKASYSLASVEEGAEDEERHGPDPAALAQRSGKAPEMLWMELVAILKPHALADERTLGALRTAG
jgi:hypothetical protein